MKLSKVAISTATIATLMFVNASVTHAATPKKSIHDVAIEVIDGTYGNGEERSAKLKKDGFDFQKVQSEVNKILLGEDNASASHSTDAALEKQPTPPQAPQKVSENTSAKIPERQSVAGLDLNQSSGQVDIAALANYMVTNTANTPGYSADAWAYIIRLESEGQADISNPSSGAYGVFQLLGHGEYAGMTLREQIDMASKLPAGSWVVYP